MFNKFRGQPQVKRINRSSEMDVLVRKPQPRPIVVEEPEEPPIPSSFDDVSEIRTLSEEENEQLRQQEEDEWFRLFKGETSEEKNAAKNILPEEEETNSVFEESKEEPEMKETNVSVAEEVKDSKEMISVSIEETVQADDLDGRVLDDSKVENGMVLEETVASDAELKKPHTEVIKPEGEVSAEDKTPVSGEQDALPAEDSSNDTVDTPLADNALSMGEEEASDIEPEEPEIAVKDSEIDLPADEEPVMDEAPDAVEESFDEIDSMPEPKEQIEAEINETVLEAEPDRSEDDDEKWIQELLIDIQEKAGSVYEEEEVTEVENAVSEEETIVESSEAIDESGWYQATSLLRTAALIVLDLTENEEGYTEETSEDKESYQAIPAIPEEEPAFVPDPDELLDPVDEEFEDKPEEIVGEAAVHEVDEKLANLITEEPKNDITLDEMLDNVDRIVHETDLASDNSAEAAPVNRPRPNPNRNRNKKKKKKKR